MVGEWSAEKQLVLGNYAFHFAAENSNEPGYVTEKVYEVLAPGTVPVYLGACRDC